MTAFTDLDALLQRFPDPDPDGRYIHLDQNLIRAIDQVLDELRHLGPPATRALCERLTEPGRPDDLKPRFALHLLTVLLTREGSPAEREAFAQVLATALAGHRFTAARILLIEQLQLVGTRSVANALGVALQDPRLCDPAARALVSIREGACEAFLEALPRVDGPRRLTVLHQLAALEDPRAADTLRLALTDPDPEIRIAAGWGLARIPDPASVQPLLQAAGNCSGWERFNLSDACLDLADRLHAIGELEPAEILRRHLLERPAQPAERHLREAAARAPTHR